MNILNSNWQNLSRSFYRLISKQTLTQKSKKNLNGLLQKSKKCLMLFRKLKFCRKNLEWLKMPKEKSQKFMIKLLKL